MVDVAPKPETLREAVAAAEVRMQPATLRLVEKAVGARGKGDVLATARLSGIMAAKRTADLIPLCHPVRLVGCDLDLVTDRALPGVRVQARARAVDRTGVEIRGVRLEEKRGGKSGLWLRRGGSKPIAKGRSSK